MCKMFFNALVGMLALANFLSLPSLCDGACTVVGRAHATLFVDGAEAKPGDRMKRGKTLRMRCNEPGFTRLEGPRQAKCLRRGQFRREIGYCRADPGCVIESRLHGSFLVNGRNQEPGDVVPIGEQLELQCNEEGYTLLVGYSKVQCTEDVEFDIEIGICVEAPSYDCGYPPHIAHGVLGGGPDFNTLVGSILPIKCNDGYEISGFPRITCRPHGWSRPGECFEQNECGDPPLVANGFVGGGPNYDKSVGSMYPIICDEGYEISGLPRITCESVGWSRPGECLRKNLPSTRDCGAPPLVPNGWIDGVPHSSQRSTVPIKCNAGYTMYGWPRTTCSSAGWSRPGECVPDAVPERSTTTIPPCAVHVLSGSPEGTAGCGVLLGTIVVILVLQY